MASQINASNSGFGGIVSTGDSSGQLQLQTAGTTAVTIDTSQNVGIGTTSPTNRLHVFGPSGDYRTALFESASTAGPSVQIKGSRIYELRSTNTGAGEGAGLFFIYDKTAEASRMAIDTSGNVLINTTSGFNAGKMCLQFDGNGNIGFAIRNSVATNQVIMGFYNSSNTAIGSIQQNTFTSVAFITSSDYRLKENIAPMVGALEKVVQLKPVTYTWKADGSDGQGFIAHELQAVIPDAVVGEKDAVETYTDEEGNEQTRIKAQGIDTSFLVATLTAAIQEQQTIINDLKARVTALEAK